MELRIAALDDVPGWSVLRRPEVSVLLHGADEVVARVAAALDERRGEDVVDVVVDTLTADGFRATPDFALATPDGRLVARGAGEVRLPDDSSVVAGPRMPWRDEDAPGGVGEVTLAVVGVEAAAPAQDVSTPDVAANEGSAEPAVEEPAAGPVDEPAETPAPEPVDEPAETPAPEPVDEPAETPAPEPVDEPAETPAPEPAAAPPAPAGGWAMPSVFGAAGSPPAPPSPAPVPSQDGDPAGRPTLTVVPEPQPVAEQPVVVEPVEEPAPVGGSGDEQQAAVRAAASASTDEEEDELPSFDFLFGATSHHRSSLIAKAQEDEDQIDSGPVAAAGGYQAPEESAHATLAPPQEEHDEPEPPADVAAQPGSGQPEQERPEPAQPVPAPGPVPPPAATSGPFDPPPATAEGTPAPPPPAGGDGLISAVPWGAQGTSSSEPVHEHVGAPSGEPVPDEPSAPEPQAPAAYEPPAAPEDHAAEHHALDQAAPEQPAHEPGAVPPPPVAPFGVGLPSAMPSFGTPTASGPRPLEPAQEHDPYAVPESTGPMVLAVRCSSGHASAPHAVSCRVCGAPLPSQQPEPTPRPALGLLRLSTGDVVTLDRGVLIGRAPKSAPELPAAQAPHLVRVPSPDNEISRNHVEVILDGWHVLVRDLGSTNGTTITLPQDHPVRLRPGDQQSIEPGTTITLADQVSAVFEVTG